MRTASHNILYTVVNSRAYSDSVNTGSPVWVKILIVVDVILIGFIVCLEYLTIKKYKRLKSEMVEKQTKEE